ncbi:hypothetical protein C8T65DRAFT_697057 [Cerioporus squamosus]|nr:hypothetical protein C8T65DRAFT_697057 [Cerioporus squamosus]
MPCQLTVALVFITAIAVGLVSPLFLPADVLLQLHGIKVNEATRIHVRAAVRSTQQAILALPCLLPPIAELPLVCGGPRSKDLGRPSCIGAIDMLFDQQALTRRLVYHTLPSGDFLTPLTSVVDIVEDIAASGESEGSLSGSSNFDSLDIGMLQPCIAGMYELSEHMRLLISRLDATQGMVVHASRDFGWLPKWVSLRRTMEIAHAGVVDSAIYVSNASNVTRTAVSELRGRLLRMSNSSAHCERVDILSSCAKPGTLGIHQGRMASEFAILQASYLLGDVESTLQSLEEDLREAIDHRDLGRRLLHTMCPMALVDAWLQAQHRSHDVHVKHLRAVRAEAKKLLDRVGGGLGARDAEEVCISMSYWAFEDVPMGRRYTAEEERAFSVVEVQYLGHRLEEARPQRSIQAPIYGAFPVANCLRSSAATAACLVLLSG